MPTHLPDSPYGPTSGATVPSLAALAAGLLIGGLLLLGSLVLMLLPIQRAVR